MSKDFSNWYVIKRDNETLVPFDDKKITKAISNAIKAVDNIDKNTNELTEKTATTEVLKLLNDHIRHNTKGDVVFSVEEIQNCVEKTLVTLGLYEVAKEYITYREKRNQLRMMNSSLMQTYKDFILKDVSEIDELRENANIDAITPMGGILKFGTEASKMFAKLFLMSKKFAKLHDEGYAHQHDLDFYSQKSLNCIQQDIKSLLSRGYFTGHGFLRPPSEIRSAAALTCIAIQSSQCDMHGGQSIANFDYGLAPYVAKTYIKKIVDLLEMTVSENTLNFIKTYLKDYYKEHNDLLSEKARKEFVKQLAIYCCNDSINESTHADDVETLIAFFVPYVEKAVERTDKETYQAMEALVHNFNTLKSRSGGQVPFSSINFGTDTTEEGRMVSINFLKALDSGLGKHETSIFPVAIFQVKRGFNYNKEDPNYDIFKLSCEVSSRRLFPNYVYEDAPFNKQYYKEGRPETLVALMGCRTRVIGNVYDPEHETTYGRGNISFTTINLPLLALDAKNENPENSIDCFFEKLKDLELTVFDQLIERMNFQMTARVENFPTIMGQHLWMGSENLSKKDTIESVIKHGTLSVGFVGLAETLKVLVGKHHGESEEAQELGLKIIKFMRDLCDEKSQEMKLNFSLIGTPAESTAGRFLRVIRKKYGVIPGVSDHEFITNSSHLPVYFKTSIKNKIDIEAPYHKYCNAGCILYVEMDGDPSKNVDAFMSVVKYAESKEVNYFSINHAVDRCPVCNYIGVIDDSCPRCGFNEETGVDLEKLKELQKYYPGIEIPKI